jgi:CelD/BcsL family acetyltransferase involved in cellulose biosynthesis
MYKVDIATQNELENWNDIITQCPYSEALHTIEWRNALKENFKQLHPLYFLIRDDGAIVGALPFFIFHPIPMVKMLLSMPWALPGGPLIFPEAHVESVVMSVNEKIGQVSDGCKSFETVLNTHPNSGPDLIDKFESIGYAKSENFTHILETRKGYDEVWKAYNKRVRGAVRKANKTGVIVRETEDESDMIDFYNMYISLMKRFNNTPKPYDLLRYLQISSIARLVVAEIEKKVVAGLLFLHFNSAVRLWCEASDPDYLKYRPNNAIIDYIIRWACEHGYSHVDFGASPPESKGLIAFKEEWKAQKTWFYTFTKLHSSWKNKLWVASEPGLRRVYSAIQRFRLRRL